MAGSSTPMPTSTREVRELTCPRCSLRATARRGRIDHRRRHHGGIRASCLELAADPPPPWPTVGIHPNDITELDRRLGPVVALPRPRVVGHRRDGLDRHWDRTPFAVQEEWFVVTSNWAVEHDRTVVIHCREAEPDMLRCSATIRPAWPYSRVMHSFVGTWETAEACLAMGLYLSFAGMLTYRNAGALRQVAASPLDRVLVETDVPYLAPVPLRGKRNEPAHVVHTASCLAGLRGLAVEQIAEQTTRNAQALFGIPVN